MRTTADLRAFQRLMARAVVRPLAAGDRLDPRWIDGRRTADVAAEFVKPNARLTASERLQIYNRMYWYRLIGCMNDDCPGLRALLGERAFARLARAYLAKFPSRSFTLRNLCSRLPGFIRSEPRWTAPLTALAHDTARFEWAQTVAFDAEAWPALDPARLAGTPPSRLRIPLQPYLSLLVLGWPLDDFVLAVKRRNALRAEASNAVEGRGARRVRRAAPPRRGRIRLAVHRHDGRLYYRRLEPAEHRILAALASGLPVSRAVAAAGRRVRPGRVREWFAAWTRLGWLCTKP
jgi:hypothetical protein